MDYELKKQYYNIYRNSHQLQEKLERDVGDLTPGEKEEIRMEIIQLYLVVDGREPAILMLNDYIDQWVTPRNLFRSANPVRAYILLILLYENTGRHSLAEETLDRFKTFIKYSGGDAVSFSPVVAYTDILEAMIKQNSFDENDMLNKINAMEKFYEGNRHSLPIDFSVSIQTFFSHCYFKMNDMNKAVEYWKKAVALSEIAGFKVRTNELYRLLAAMYESRGQYKEALENYNIFCKNRNEIRTAKEYAYSDFLISEYGIKSGAEIARISQEKRLAAERKIEKDSLTGLYNRRHMTSVLAEALKREPSVVVHAVMFDIDFFRGYNENYGHLKGDRILEKIGGLLGALTSDTVTPIRYGGEEFLLLVQDQSVVETEIVANTVLQDVRNRQYENSYSDISKYVTLSAGIASLECKEPDDVYALCDMAEKALGKAKADGRNKCVRYNQL